MKKSSNNIYSCTGLLKVFSFTLSQTFKNRAYRVSYIMFIVLMMVMGPINQLGMSAGMGAAHSTDAINDKMDLKQIYFVNDTYLDFSSEKAELDGTGFAAAKLTDAEAVPDKLAADEIAVLLDRQMIDEVDTYVLNIIAADDSDITPIELDALGGHLMERLEQARRDAADLGDEEMKILQMVLESGSALTYEDYEAEINSAYTSRQVSSYNMLYSIVLMILVALTGSYVVSSVMEEKMSKLVENLLVSVRPLALILGKILAMMFYVFSMIVLGMGGSFITNKIAESVFGTPAVQNVADMMNFSRLFTFAGFKGLLLLPCMLLTYFMYSMLAGLMGSACTRMEDAQSAIGTVTMVNMVGYMIGMVLPNVENSTALLVASIIPFVSSYIAPVSFICGRIPLWSFLLGILLQIALCAILFRICAKTYRKLIVNDSKRLKLFEIIKLSLAKEA